MGLRLHCTDLTKSIRATVDAEIIAEVRVPREEYAFLVTFCGNPAYLGGINRPTAKERRAKRQFAIPENL
jgi:hypothetical protein